MKYFLLGLKWLFMKPAVHFHLLVSLKVHGALPLLSHLSSYVMLNLSQKNLDFLFLKYHYYKKHKNIAVHTISLYLLIQILGKRYIKVSHPCGGYIHQQQIFQQKRCPLMFLAIDSDFWTSLATQLQEGIGSYIVSYFDDDEEEEKEEGWWWCKSRNNTSNQRGNWNHLKII